MEDLEKKLITFSVGIGLSEETAEAAVEAAKRITREEPYNILVNREIPEKYEPQKNNVRSYRTIKKFFAKHKASGREYQALKDFLSDPLTGLLNKSGYAVFMDDLKAKGVNDGVYIYLDGNNMKRHNTANGKKWVNYLLSASGKAVHSHIRTINGEKNKGKRKKITYHDIAAHRLHDSAGDEIVVYLPLEQSKTPEEKFKIAEEVARRVLTAVYEAQREVLEGKYS